MHDSQNNALAFANRIKGLGFTVYLAKQGNYGFITDDTGSHVMCFSFTDGGSLSGNYGPPSRISGTGWRLEQEPHDLQTAVDVRRALYASAPHWCGNGWKHYTTLQQHLAMYGASSQYVQV